MLFLVLAAASALAVASAPLPPHTLTWAPLGEPGCGGDIVSVRIDPYNTTRIYISGDMLGVGVSLNNGTVSSSFLLLPGELTTPPTVDGKAH